MVKTLSCKTTDEMYNLIDRLKGDHSFHLRKALEEYLEKYYGYKKKSQHRGDKLVGYSDSREDADNEPEIDTMHKIHDYIDNLKDIKDKK